jgi:hypothetical protein
VPEGNDPAYHPLGLGELHASQRLHPMSEELRDKARTLGLDRLTEEHLAQFERATTGMERHLRRLPRGIPAAQEPAHVYRAKGETS